MPIDGKTENVEDVHAKQGLRAKEPLGLLAYGR
jgi:hypothetical protein